MASIPLVMDTFFKDKHTSMPNVYIVILNWNGWHDTIECLESVFRINYLNYRVVVCDNKSQDDSLQHIKAWAEGNVDVYVNPENFLKGLSFPPIAKPIRYVEYNRVVAEAGGDSDDQEARLILIQTGANLGFAGGNNVGLKYALAKDDFEYIWLLNNDTVIKSDSLSTLVARMQEKPRVGICGSTLLYYNSPDTIQACGGATYNFMTGKPKHIGALNKIDQFNLSTEFVEQKCAYIIGASMFVSKRLLIDVGLLSEDYFLYFEELDWAVRANKLFELSVAKNSIVYHKEGSSVGSSHNPYKTSELSDYYSVVNRLKFTSKHYKHLSPLIWLSLFGVFINRVKRRLFSRAWVIIKIFFGWRLRR